MEPLTKEKILQKIKIDFAFSYSLKVLLKKNDLFG
jgi:hypothetical protein